MLRIFRFACSDIKKLSKHKAVVAVSSFRGARDILEKFREDKRVKVEQYNVLQHSDTVRAFLWAGVIFGIIGLSSAVLGRFP